jgi:signal transduction histidine kinase
MICVPLQAKGATLGALEVLNREDGKDFDEEDLDWLTTLAAQASIAIDNARLYSSLREERDRIIETEEEVRRQLARNLHDGVSQVLSALMMNIEVTRRLASAGDGDLHTEFDFLRGLAQQANQEIRHTLHELRPLVLESQGLLAALEAHVAHQKQRNFEITLEARNLPHFDNRRTESAVFMIVQEGLNNVRKHAGADNVWLRLAVADSDLVVEIEDDGRGFDLNAAIANYGNSGSFGLLSMRERTERLDGTLTIKSPRDAGAGGTLVVLRVPLSRLS